MKFLLGRKIGMTRVYDERGAIRPVTVIQAGPCVVTQVKSVDTDGYLAVQVAFGARKHTTQPLAGHLKKSQQTSAEKIVEVRVTKPEEISDITPGAIWDVTAFAPGDMITVSGTSKGKGFAGVVKRHGFAGGPKTHGSDFHRAPGAIGGRWPQRVVKGRRMAGHLGVERVTIKGLSVLRIDQEHNILAVSGAIPGPRRSLVEIRGVL